MGGDACGWTVAGVDRMEGGMPLVGGPGCCIGGVVVASVAPHFQHTDKVGGFAAPQ